MFSQAKAARRSEREQAFYQLPQAPPEIQLLDLLRRDDLRRPDHGIPRGDRDQAEQLPLLDRGGDRRGAAVMIPDPIGAPFRENDRRGLRKAGIDRALDAALDLYLRKLGGVGVDRNDLKAGKTVVEERLRRVEPRLVLRAAEHHRRQPHFSPFRRRRKTAARAVGRPRF